MMGKRRVPQRTGTRALPRDPMPVAQATIALPREDAHPGLKPRPHGPRPNWAHLIRPDRENR